jgi:hypothetical protein
MFHDVPRETRPQSSTLLHAPPRSSTLLHAHPRSSTIIHDYLRLFTDSQIDWKLIVYPCEIGPPAPLLPSSLAGSPFHFSARVQNVRSPRLSLPARLEPEGTVAFLRKRIPSWHGGILETTTKRDLLFAREESLSWTITQNNKHFAPGR